MTLPSNCLSAEPAATPSDPLACFGASAPSPDAAAAGTPFASLLTQADVTGATTGATLGEAAPAVSNEPTLYPGIFYLPFVGPQTVPATVPGGVPDPVQVAAQTVVTGKKPEIAQEPAPKEKQKVSAKSGESSDDDAGQNAMQLAYQFIAGQWVPQTVVAEQVASPDLEAQPGSPVSATSSLVATTPAFSQNGQPDQGQRAVQSKPELAKPAIAEDREVATPSARTVLPPPPSAVGSKESIPVPAAPANHPATSSSQKVAPDDKLQPTSGSENPAVAVSPETATADTGISAQAWRLQQSRLQAQEKIAAPALPGSSELASGVNPSNETKEKKTVVDGFKGLTSSKPNIGTDTANRENAMPHSAVNKASTVALPTIVDDGIRAGNGSAAAQVEGSTAAHAPKLVQEIRQIADRISSIDRNTVEVRFDFSDTERLSVRVEYRDGAVHTTFRTDSSQLRDAISHEWQAQSAVADQKSYRMTEPVFSQTTSDRQNFSSTGGGDGSGRQRAFEQAAQSATPSYASTGRNVGSAISVAAPAARSSRPETSLHLHALA